jgi:release factor glutamine methyltransferase
VIVREAWAGTREQLAKTGVADASLEAEVLLRTALGVDRTGFVASLNMEIAPDRALAAEGLIARRLAGEPLAYIVGSREFYGLDFVVNASVLVPRQETEHLVDAVVDFSRSLGDPPLEIADVGTGSGAIAVAVARHLPAATVYATDASRTALEVADANRRRHGVADRVSLHEGDLLEALLGTVDVIVSNPPYIATAEFGTLPADVLREPMAALDGGPDGLSVTRRLIRRAPSYLRPGGRLVVEIAPAQLDAATRIATEVFADAEIGFQRDLAVRPRILVVDLGREARVVDAARAEPSRNTRA